MTASFDELRAGLLAGDQTAARNLFVEFASRLVSLARSRMDQRLLQKVDAEDVVQSVYKSFFLRAADGQFEFDNWDNLWTILAVITMRKCGHRIEHFHAACRDVRREQAHAPFNPNESVASFEAIARDPQPSEAALFTETLERVMQQLDEREREMLTLRLQGHSTAEIAPPPTSTRWERSCIACSPAARRSKPPVRWKRCDKSWNKNRSRSANSTPASRSTWRPSR